MAMPLSGGSGVGTAVGSGVGTAVGEAAAAETIVSGTAVGAADAGAEDAGGDIGGWRTPRKQADDFRLREYGAHAGNGGGLSPSGGFTELRQLHAEDAGKDL